MFNVQCSMFNEFCTFALTMSTVIYPSPIFGPIHSRRLGISLGINLQPADGKVCTFDCIYCECGFNSDHRPTLPRPSRQLVAQKLEEQLQKMVAEGQLPDVLTFAGNGEPTGHPHFAEIIDDTIRLRDQYCPNAKVCVLSNSTMIHSTFKVQSSKFKVQSSKFNVDNTGEEFVSPWLEVVKQIKPQQVMVYTIDRETPAQGLEKASREQLDAIRDRVIAAGIPCTASY